MQGRKPKSPAKNIPCTNKGCKGKATITYPRTNFDGRLCKKCGLAVLTCHWCYGIVCEWEQGPELSEYENMPHVCPTCGALMYVRDYKGPPRFDVQHFMVGVQKWTTALKGTDLSREGAQELFEELVEQPGHSALRIRSVETTEIVLEAPADDGEDGEEGA
jgi:hypothetical protein